MKYIDDEGNEVFPDDIFRNNIKLFPIDIDIDVPSNHWQVGAQVFPSDTTDRTSRFQQFRDLYDGRHGTIMPKYLDTYSLIENYFKDFAEFIPIVLMSTPPEANVDDTLLNDLRRSLRRSLVDYSRYGTSIMSLYIKEDGSIGINVLDPRFFFTHTSDNYTYLSISKGVMVEHKWLNGVAYIGSYEVNGTNIESVISALEPVSTYEDLPIAIVARGEPNGIWGESMYYDMYQENIAISKRLSGLDSSFDLFEKPRLYKYGYNADELAMQNVKNANETKFIENERRYAVDKGLEINTNASNVDFKTPARFDQATQEFVDRMLNLMHSKINIPQSLYGYYKGDAASKVTGETMRESQKSIGFMCADLVCAFVPELERILSIAEGRDVSLSWLEEEEPVDNTPQMPEEESNEDE